MNTKKLNAVPDCKGSKKSVGSDQQIANSVVMENAKVSNKVTYLRPVNDAKIDDWFKYQKQTFNHQFEVEILESAIIAKYSDVFGIQFAKDLFSDACEFTSNFSMDICNKLEDGIEGKDISYLKDGNTITRYLVAVDSVNVCSIFRHFFDYAKSSNRSSVLAIIESENKEREQKRLANLNERREKRETEKVGAKVKDLDIEKLLSMLSPKQIAAIKAAKIA